MVVGGGWARTDVGVVGASVHREEGFVPVRFVGVRVGSVLAGASGFAFRRGSESKWIDSPIVVQWAAL